MENAPAGRLFTVGHSNHPPEHFLGLLRAQGITAVADVRSSPYSRRQPHFSRPQLEGALRREGIAYVFLGDLLGGRPADRSLYDPEGWADYEKVRATRDFARGLDRLGRGLGRYTIALVCGEKDPLDCHRGLMIAPALVERGLSPVHLRGDGTVETTHELEARLLAETGLSALVDGLFQHGDAWRREVLARAYREMNRKKAFRLAREEDGD
jgi:uncharacterized protein (DUF488 family)